MGKTRYLVIPLVMVFVLACGLSTGIQAIQQAATQLPGILTSAPTALGAIETSAAAQSSSACGTPTSGGLGIGLDNAKTVLQLTQQVTFTDGTVDGQPVSTATLTSTAASSFPDIASGFSAQFIGDPCNLSKILVTAPRTDQQTADQGIAIINILVSGFMPLDVQVPLLAWLSQNYSNLPVSGQQQTTIGTMMFTLGRTQTEMTLEVVPAK